MTGPVREIHSAREIVATRLTSSEDSGVGLCEGVFRAVKFPRSPSLDRGERQGSPAAHAYRPPHVRATFKKRTGACRDRPLFEMGADSALPRIVTVPEKEADPAFEAHSGKDISRAKIVVN